MHTTYSSVIAAVLWPPCWQLLGAQAAVPCRRHGMPVPRLACTPMLHKHPDRTPCHHLCAPPTCSAPGNISPRSALQRILFAVLRSWLARCCALFAAALLLLVTGGAALLAAGLAPPPIFHTCGGERMA